MLNEPSKLCRLLNVFIPNTLALNENRNEQTVSADWFLITKKNNLYLGRTFFFFGGFMNIE